MRYIQSLIFRAWKRQFTEFLIVDYYGEIPKNVVEPALIVLGEKKTRVDQLIIWQTYLLQRRFAKSQKEADIFYGMLLQLKLLRAMLGTSKAIDGTDTGLKPAAFAALEREKREKEEAEKLKNAIENFKKGQATSNNPQT